MLGRIPYEIFREIIKLAYVYELSIPSSFNDFNEISLPPIEATHVCRAWRIALLSDPAMWNGIRLRASKIYLDELNETLRRSGSLPLDILIEWGNFGRPLNLDVTYGDPDPVVSVILPVMRRCRQLQIITSDSSLVSPLSQCLDHPLPMLEKFYLEVFEDYTYDDMIRRQFVLRGIHKVLFSGDAPNLTHVHLQIPDGMEDLRLSLFNNLSSLHLQFITRTIIDGNVFLNILQLSPHLRILDITWSWSRPEFASSLPASYRIPLPRLQQLSLRGNCGVDVVNFLLGHLNLPTKNVNFDIICDDLHDRISDSAPLLHFLTQRHFTFLSIAFTTWDPTVKFFEKMNERLPATSSVFKTPYDEADAHLDHLPDFLRIFNLSDITHLSMERPTLKSLTFRRIFRSLENLQYLCACHRNWEGPLLPSSPVARSYLKALMPQLHHPSPQTRSDSEPDTDDSTGSGPIIEASQNTLATSPQSGDRNLSDLCPCPSLHTLELTFHYDSLDSEDPFFQTLARCSRIRGQAGLPLKSINIHCKSSDLARDIEARLQAYRDETFPVEVEIIHEDVEIIHEDLDYFVDDSDYFVDDLR